MKTNWQTAVTFGCIALIAGSIEHARAADSQTFANTTSITLNDTSPFGIAEATPYPSIIRVAGYASSKVIARVTVTLHGLKHATPDDLDMLLVGPSGKSVILLSDVGGGFANEDVPVTITLDDLAAQSVANDGPLFSGVYRPSNNDDDGWDRFPTPAPAYSSPAKLSTFARGNPNGDWQLFIVDDDALDRGSISGGWSLTIESVDSDSALAAFPAAANFTTIHNLNPGDGVFPEAGLLLSGENLFGTAPSGGTGYGAVFSVSTNGTTITTTHAFDNNIEGAAPVGGLVLSGDTVYGTTTGVGVTVNGIALSGNVFAVNTNGTGFRVLHTFTSIPKDTNSDGALPRAKLLLSGNTLYGTTVSGGIYGKGVVFKVNTDGGGFANLHSFRGPTGSASGSEGAGPRAELILVGGILYGTTAFGSAFDYGTLFKINTNGTGFSTIYNFTGAADGANPFGGLVSEEDMLYGATLNRGDSQNGTIFAVRTNGTGFVTLHSFSPIVSGSTTNADGAHPSATMLFVGNALYGTATSGGAAGNGTVFAVNRDGSNFTNIHSFTATAAEEPHANGDGANPNGQLILADKTLYGTTVRGGNRGYGVIFSISLSEPPPELRITRIDGDVIVTWANTATPYTLETTPNLSAPVVWSPITANVTVVNGENRLSESISSAMRFYCVRQ